MFFGALLFAILLESSCGAVGAAEVKAGAMMSIRFEYYAQWRSQSIELPKDPLASQGFQDKKLYSLTCLMRSEDSRQKSNAIFLVPQNLIYLAYPYPPKLKDVLIWYHLRSTLAVVIIRLDCVIAVAYGCEFPTAYPTMVDMLTSMTYVPPFPRQRING